MDPETRAVEKQFLSVQFAADPEELLGSLEHGDGVRAFAGHSGWGEGQLENEMKQNAWKICPPHPVLLDRPAAPALWMAFAGEDQRWRNLISLLPKDAGQN